MSVNVPDIFESVELTVQLSSCWCTKLEKSGAVDAASRELVDAVLEVVALDGGTLGVEDLCDGSLVVKVLDEESRVKVVGVFVAFFLLL